MIAVCPHCKVKTMPLDDDGFLGERSKCPRCGNWFRDMRDVWPLSWQS